MHDTALSPPGSDPGRASGCTCQREPSQRSANATDLTPLINNHPTAMHAVADGHDTPPKLQLLAEAGFAVYWIDHSVPFDLRTWGLSPTAVHALADGHETAFRLGDPLGIT